MSPEIKEWAAGNDVLLRHEEIKEWVCFLIDSDHPVLAVKLIRQAYRCNSEDVEIILKGISGSGDPPNQGNMRPIPRNPGNRWPSKVKWLSRIACKETLGEAEG